MTSDLIVNDECLTLYEELKTRKKYKYIIFKLLDNGAEIVVEESVEKGTHEDFSNCLFGNVRPRYAVYDFDYEKPGEGQRSKIIFVTWIPGDSHVRDKMIYDHAKSLFCKKLVGLEIDIKASDISDITYDTVLEKASRSA